MITLITGTPGAGKTLYAISKLLRDLVGSVVAGVDDSGNKTEVPRIIYTNINGLLIDHELIDGGAEGGLANWHKWAKPGSVICFDEVQREWPPRANGSKVPDYISALETHRHMGVDFIILTQNPMLLDRNVLALVGRHLHVRRFGGMGAALVYEWDHCSRQLLYSKALKKFPFKYDKSVFKLYKSAELHTKPKISIPPLVFVVIVALICAAVFIPQTYSRIANKSVVPAGVSRETNQDSVSDKAKSVIPDTVSRETKSQAYDSASFVPRVSYEPLSAPAYDALRVVVNMPVIVGGMCFRGECKCYTQQGTNSGISSAECGRWIANRPFDAYTQQPQQQLASASLSETASVHRQSARAQTVPAPSKTATEMGPLNVGGAINPKAERAPPPVLPPGSPVHPTLPMGVSETLPPPNLLNPHRRT